MNLAGLKQHEVAAIGLPKQVVDQVLPGLLAKNFLVFLKLELGMEVGTPQKEWWSILKQRQDTVILAPRDHGKLVAHYEEVLTYNRGWTTHGDLRVGDKVFSPEGKPITVMGLSEDGVASLRVEISDGSTVDVHPLHEWEVWDRNKKCSRVVETRDLMKELWTSGKDVRARFQLPDVYEIESQEEALSIPPYVFGLWLGDGVHTKATIAQSAQDSEVFEEVEKTFKPTSVWVHPDTGVIYKNYQGMWPLLKGLGVVGNKHIPEQYLRGSIAQRKELLAGLIDSDGCVEDKGTYQRVRFTNCNLSIVEGVERLCASLNWPYSRSVAEPVVSSSGVEGRQRVYTVRITPMSSLPNRLIRKAVTGSRAKGIQKRAIVGVREIAPVPGRCIQVEGERGVYLVGRGLVPTHNSHTIIRGYAAWKAKYDPFIQEILILGADTSSAIDNLDKFKAMLAASASLKDLLPTDRKNFNTRAEIRLTNGVVIKAKGFGATLRGRHPQLILLDDVVNEKNSSSEEGRKKVHDYFWAVVYPMKDKGTQGLRDEGYRPQIVVVGTAQNEDDLYHELLKNESLVGVKQSALVNIERKEVLWPERYSWDDLMKIKSSMGSLQFAKEYCNEPITDDTSLFPSTLFTPMLDYNRSYILDYNGSNPIYLGADFSVPGEQGGDYTAVITAEKLPGEVLALTSIWRDKPETMSSQVSRIADITTRMKVVNGLLEANMFQKVYAEHFKKYTNLPLKGTVVTASGKNSLETGVLSFRPLFENQKFLFPYKTPADRELTDTLIREFAGLVRKDGKLGNFRFHDDCVMALWHCLNASRQTKFTFEF